MSNTKKDISVIFVLAAVLVSCKEPYTPPVIKSTTNYLVVDGIINTGLDSTIIKLSRTVMIGTTTGTKVETGAQVTVESNTNNIYALKEIAPGTYAIPPLNVGTTAQYRLRIITSDHKTYLSDFVAAKESPPIDSVGFTTSAGAVQLYVNSNDPANNTHYYRWDYSETWKFRVPFEAQDIYLNGVISLRPANMRNYICYTNDTSSSITLGSSAKLTQDVIYHAPLTAIPTTSEKISMEYSILVTQYALTGEGVTFWQLMKTNTEDLGSIFDAQPSETAGNIHNINNGAEPVIGYVSAGTAQQKRIFIQNSQLPAGWGGLDPIYDKCYIDSIFDYNINDFTEPDPLFIPMQIQPVMAFDVNCRCYRTAYLGVGRICADCTTRGVKAPPVFWK